MAPILFEPIGWVRSPYTEPSEAPPQSFMREGVLATIELRPEYAEGLADLVVGDYLVVLFHFHLSQGFSLRTKTPWSAEPRGVFSTRSPYRPNPIGLSIVQLIAVDGCRLTIDGVDMVDGTPVLDIKVWWSDLVPSGARNQA
jgi:tRNA-Thr(GGU) m(6)t(6)A37 methyltransferase TsaA